MGNVNMEADQIRFKNGTYRDVQSGLTAALQGGGGGGAAEDITYDNTVSGLTADDVQAAIDEVAGAVDDLETTVGDSSSGLVKDVDDLQTTVGDAESGLVKGVADLQSSVTALNNRLENRTNYTSNETAVGYYLGEVLYRRVITISNTSAGGNNISISSWGNVSIKRIYGSADSSSYTFTVPYYNAGSDHSGDLSISAYLRKEDETLIFNCKNTANYKIEAVVEYTKPSAPETNDNK